MEIEFTQYLRPHGQKKKVRIDRPKAVADKAKEIKNAGLCLECEVLMSGDVSFTIANEELDLAFEIVPNGPEVPDAVDRLILNFDLDNADALIEALNTTEGDRG